MSEYTLKGLRPLAKELGIRGYSTANKAQLIEMLAAHAKTKGIVEGVKAPVEEPKAVQKPQTTPEHTPAPTPAPTSTPTPTVFEDNSATTKAPRKKKTESEWDRMNREYMKEHKCSLKESMTACSPLWAAKKAAQSKA
jgi:hypothetical protein